MDSVPNECTSTSSYRNDGLVPAPQCVTDRYHLESKATVSALFIEDKVKLSISKYNIQAISMDDRANRYESAAFFCEYMLKQ